MRLSRMRQVPAALFVLLVTLFCTLSIGTAEAVTVTTFGYNSTQKAIINKSDYSQVLEAEDLVRAGKFYGNVIVAPAPWQYMVWMFSSGSRLYADFTATSDTVAVQFAYSDSNDGIANIYVDGQLATSLDSNNQGNWYVEISDLPSAQHKVIIEARYNNYYYNDDLHIDAIAARTSNKPPVADAGPDQTANEFSSVTLNGSESKDPEGKALVYEWTQVAGSSVDLNISDPSHPTFTAPAVSRGGETLTFQLIVKDGALSSSADIVNVNVKNIDHPPVADAGPDMTVGEASSVTLDGSASYDPDGDVLTFYWHQTAGPNVGLSDSTAAQPVFTAPMVGVDGATLTFELTVTDGIESVTDTVNVLVENVNHPPVANAGTDLIRNEGNTVVLNGASSSDADGDAITYTWTQLEGVPVTLSDNAGQTPSFIAPLVGPEGATLVFQLVVNDGLADSAPARVIVSVLDMNSPPSCGTAKASPSALWPPNHKLMPVGIAGVKDPDNDQVDITVLDVTQDEPINGLGDGDTSPDAVIQGNTLLLRAERAGDGNGRTYHVIFRADDSFGESCVGSFTVIVPHDRNGGSTDDGQQFNSLLP